MNKKSDLELFKLILSFAAPYKKTLLGTLLILPFSSIAFSIQPFLIQKAVDGPLKDGNIEQLMFFVYLFLGAIAFNFCVHLSQIWIINSTAQKIITDIRQKLFEHLEKLPMSFFDRNPIGRTVTRITSDVEQLTDSFAGGLVSVVIDIFNIFTIISFMIYINWKLCLVLIFFLIPVTITASYFQKSYRKSNLNARTKLSALNSFLQQNIVGISVVQMLNCADKNKKIFDKSNQEYFKANDKSIWADSNFSAGIELISIISIVSLIFLSKEILIQEALSIGVIIAFLQYAQTLFEPIRNLSDRFTTIQSGFTAAERISELLSEEVSINENTSATHKLPNAQSEYLIEFDDVWFKYNDKEESPWILSGLSFKVKAGEFIAIIGKTGAGKSTIIKLLTRLYEPQRGSIRILGVDIKELSFKELRSFLAVIHQDSYIFSGDLESNIHLNRENIDMNQAKPFLQALKMDLKTELNERASNISAGEEQVINFARAVVSKAPLLILDEATAKIDLATEAFIQDELEQYRKDKTLLVIAHRLETIKHADKVIAIEHGQANLQVN
ncbi:MAG: ABC transporter ATP-binding protein/permease [Candidatus Caenarcaniphilales bacterium]|nr:ABC transporter ATP-binding protein/permease [Candidatus Caenarcaniphilales bacterium]